MRSTPSRRQEKRVDKLLYKCARHIGRQDGAWANYRDKVQNTVQLRMKERFTSLVGILGKGGYHLAYMQAGRALMLRRMFLLTATATAAYMYLTGYSNWLPSSTVGYLVALAGGNILVARSVGSIAYYFDSRGKDLLAFFGEERVEKTVRRFAPDIPGKALGELCIRGTMADICQGQNVDVLEVIDVLHEDWKGSAMELFAAARQLV